MTLIRCQPCPQQGVAHCGFGKGALVYKSANEYLFAFAPSVELVLMCGRGNARLVQVLGRSVTASSGHRAKAR